MKKLFSIATIFVLALILTGCTSSNEVVSYELSFTFTDEYGVSNTETVVYEESYEGSFKDLLILSFELDYSDSDFGTLLNSIEGLNPKNGAYVSISKNEVMSDVGIDLIEFVDGDSFGFEVIWWDTLQQDVDDLIQAFLANHAGDYVNSTSIEYNVLLALNLLEKTSEYASNSEIGSYVGGLTHTTVADYFKAIMMNSVAGVSNETLLNELNSIVATGPYGQTAYGLLALNSNITSIIFSDFVVDSLSDLSTTTPFDLGLDAGGISLVALSEYEAAADLINVYSTWISTSQLTTGGVSTRDTVWGDTTYLGTENTSSMSQVILGLIANGIDPTGDDFTKEGNNIISRILEFSTDTGSFDYIMGDDSTEDLFFSTPQAFLALVTYQIYANSNVAVNPYDFK